MSQLPPPDHAGNSPAGQSPASQSPNGKGPDCLSQLEIDEWTTGDGSAEARRTHGEHLASCSHCQQRVAASTAQARSFLRWAPDLDALQQAAFTAMRAPASAISHLRHDSHAWGQPELEQGQQGPAKQAQEAEQDQQAAQPAPARVIPMPRRALTAFGLAAAALLMLRTDAPEPMTRVKGSARLGVYIQHDGLVRRGENGDPVQPGDTLRFVYTSQESRYVTVFGDDGHELTCYHPQAETPAARAAAGKDVALDFGVELDDAPGTERFHGVFCSAPVSTEVIRKALKAAATPDGCHVDTLELRKGPSQ